MYKNVALDHYLFVKFVILMNHVNNNNILQIIFYFWLLYNNNINGSKYIFKQNVAFYNKSHLLFTFYTYLYILGRGSV